MNGVIASINQAIMGGGSKKAAIVSTVLPVVTAVAAVAISISGAKKLLGSPSDDIDTNQAKALAANGQIEELQELVATPLYKHNMTLIGVGVLSGLAGLAGGAWASKKINQHIN